MKNILSKVIKASLLALFLSSSIISFGGDHSEHINDEKPFDAKEMIMHHISDSHEFHIYGEGESSVSMPLPVILYTNNGLDVFMSSAFGHEGENVVTTSKGTYAMHHDKIYYTNENGGLTFDDQHHPINAKPLDFSITKNVFSMLLSALILFSVFLSISAKYKKGQIVPKGMQSLMEPLIIFIRDEVALPNIGEAKYLYFLPFLLTVFFFILINNLIGLVPFFPGSANLTGNIAFTFTLALITGLVTNVKGSKDYWLHILWMPGVPLFLKPLMAVLELVGVISKPFALMIRLFANITAGHIIILSLFSIIFIFKSASWAALSVPMALFMNVLELLVAFLQAYVFTMLSALFIGSAVEEHHHDEHHAEEAHA